jgi:hypothetical protein
MQCAAGGSCRPRLVFARPGANAGAAVRERDCLRGRSSCAGSVRIDLRRSDAATVVYLRIGEPTVRRGS